MNCVKVGFPAWVISVPRCATFSGGCHPVNPDDVLIFGHYRDAGVACLHALDVVQLKCHM